MNTDDTQAALALAKECSAMVKHGPDAMHEPWLIFSESELTRFYQRARAEGERAGLEQAAKMCDAKAKYWRDLEWPDGAHSLAPAGAECSAAIRALGEKP